MGWACFVSHHGHYDLPHLSHCLSRGVRPFGSSCHPWEGIVPTVWPQAWPSNPGPLGLLIWVYVSRCPYRSFLEQCLLSIPHTWLGSVSP